MEVNGKTCCVPLNILTSVPVPYFLRKRCNLLKIIFKETKSATMKIF